MATFRKIISDIRGMSKLLSSDVLITDRVINGELKSASLMLIKQQTDKRKLFSSPNLFTNLKCIEMVQVPIGECCEYTSEFMIAKSVEKLPKIAENMYGLLVQKCTGIDNLKFFKETNPRRFSNLLKLKSTKIGLYFWVENEHLYVSNGDTKRVNFTAFFEEDVPNKLLCPEDCDCKSDNCDPCINPLDLPFRCPGYLESTVKDMVAKKLLSLYFNIPTDKTSDNKDDISK